MMIDFIEYVVAELKSKRLSKTNALSLIKQYSSGRSLSKARTAVIHPLAQMNTSDFSQQSYTSVFTGEEFFLRDHQVQGHKILPGVAYLEMVRAAIDLSLPGHTSTMELRHIAWAQPIKVADDKQVTVALFSTEDTAEHYPSGATLDLARQTFEFEIYSLGLSGDETIHCQGQVALVDQISPPSHDLAALQRQMTCDTLSAASFYARIAQAGIELGAAQQGVDTIVLGEEQLLATIKLPSSVKNTLDDYLLHPSMMDSAVQAGMSLILNNSDKTDQPPIPFALERLQFFSRSTHEMFAWVRYSPGSGPQDKVIKLDIDLCDVEGKVCVQMQGFSARILTSQAIADQALTNKITDKTYSETSDKTFSETTGRLYAAPIWQSIQHSATDAELDTANFHPAHIVLCDIRGTSSRQLEQALAKTMPAVACTEIKSSPDSSMDENYRAAALACFEKIKTILTDKPQEKIFVQVVISGDASPWMGISGLLKTAALENPLLIGQLLLIDPETTADQLAYQLKILQQHSRETIVRWNQDECQALRLSALDAANAQAPVCAFKEQGVYLITGGLGGLGMLFAREILQQTPSARVMLTGRGVLTPPKQMLLDKLPATDRSRIEYRQLDLRDLVQVEECISAIQQQFGQLNGIIHAAGMVSDNFILKKNTEEFSQVLAPKVMGTFNLDLASRAIPLDFLALFSSGVSVFGNAGQADYAAANGFMDGFAGYRNNLAASKQRHGIAVAINWPLWQEGGMRPDEPTQAMLRSTAGMHPMPTPSGMQAFYQSLAAGQDQLLVVEGDLALMRRTLLGEHPGSVVPEKSVTASTPIHIDGQSLLESTLEYLRKEFSVVLKLPPHKIDTQAPLENYGIDSILAMDLTAQLEKTFGSLPKTLFFEYQTLQELNQYFVKAHAEKLSRLFTQNADRSGSRDIDGNNEQPRAELASVPDIPSPQTAARFAKSLRRQRLLSSPATDRTSHAEPIAIIGLSGRYPEAWNINDYWNNLRDGRDCIVEVPGDRWDWRDYYSEDRTKEGRHYSKWGGFIQGVDEFDPIFFGIPPVDAELIDPQERLFLEHAWMAMEDAGYTRAKLQQVGNRSVDNPGLPGQVGVYVGVMYGEYQLFGAEASLRGQRMGIPVSYASIANRVSYVLNLHGPSMTLDTMCSSSLTAIHLACQDLKQGRIGLAIAGGVNVTIHPNKYLLLSAGQFISSDGHCQSFGEGGDGYIPGEGVGTVILKRLSEAKADKNPIYGVIKGTALNHGGKTNGYSVPNPQAQANVIAQALLDAQTDPRHISYLEAHGTGTKLGDPIEIAALCQAFYPLQDKEKAFGFCLIGSAKSNIGHCESAAGVAGLTKILLQMKHRQIVPSLHSEKLNPHIDFARSPFVVNQTLMAWEQPVIDGKSVPRTAGISSFGAGGSNAHIVIEEYQPSYAPMPIENNNPVVVPLSARTEDQLRQKVRDLLDFIADASTPIDLQALAYTLQVGREAMEERLACIVFSIDELKQKLQAFQAGETHIDDCYRGQVRANQEGMALISQDEDMSEAIKKWILRKKITKLVDLWTKGLALDWNEFYQSAKPALISLPTYPFAREKYWIQFASKERSIDSSSAKLQVAAFIHPLLHINTSDFFQQSYSSTFTGEEIFLKDHQVRVAGSRNQQPVAQKILPAVAYLEMVRAALEQASPGQADGSVLELRNLAWIQPLILAEGSSQTRPAKSIAIALLPHEKFSSHDQETVDFEVYSVAEEVDGDAVDEVIHCQGQAIFIHQTIGGSTTGLSTTSFSTTSLSIDRQRLAAEMQHGKIEPQQLYELYEKMGIYYGPSYRGVIAIHQGDRQLLAEICLPAINDDHQSRDKDFVLHPGLLDSSLQASIGLMNNQRATPDQPMIPFAVDLVRILSACPTRLYAWVRYAEDSPQAGLVKLDLDLFDTHGNICVQMRGLTSRTLQTQQIVSTNKNPALTTAKETHTGTLLAVPVWQDKPVVTSIPVSFAEHHIILCSLQNEMSTQLSARLESTNCLALSADGDHLAAGYTAAAVACFTLIQNILQRKPRDKVLIQIVVSHEQEMAIYAGLSGLLKSVALENPGIVGQVILSNPAVTVEELAAQLQQELANTSDMVVRYQQGIRQVPVWQEIAEQPEDPPSSFADNKVYLITGGLGGLGTLFARDIIQQTKDSRIIFAGRSVMTPEKQHLLEQLTKLPHRTQYHQCDMTDLGQVETLISDIISEHGRLDGIIHSAGLVRDNFVLKKSVNEFQQVLAPKVSGTFNLDHATRDLPLDFLVLFSSISGAMGNYGQTDYAAANGFMDQFARYRNQLRIEQQRQGKTLSINWPFWQEGGMNLDEDSLQRMRQTIGMLPLQTATGVRSFHHILTLPHDQVLVMEGDLQLMRSGLLALQKSSPAVTSNTNIPVNATSTDSAVLIQKTSEYLTKEFATLLKLPAHEVDIKAPLEKYGIDSILALKLTNRLEETFGSLSKTLFFEYQSLIELADYIARSFPQIIQQKFGLQGHNSSAVKNSIQTLANPAPEQRQRIRHATRKHRPLPNASIQHDVAIVGLAGRYPQADNLEAFWENLKSGRDCITDIPAERWDNSLYFHPERNQPGKSYSNWGGFINHVDKFDALFFNVSPKEAELIDPQERLFMETVWETIEDAGYSKEAIGGKRIGVYVGVMWGQYELFGAESILHGGNPIPTSSYASIANRVSYFFNFHGPSIALDTMCSSSITAIHLASEDIRRGEVEAAIAGGVNVSIHPHKYLNLSQGNFHASDGRCRSFGDGGDGYVPGEGVGAVLLKTLSQAIADGDQIYGVIKSSTINHGGKTNGYTVPNPNAQANLILEALKKAKVEPLSLSYLETHGTGTALGDPIEITGLNKAFAEFNQGKMSTEKQYCPIGSVKSNIGHLESAAGIAAVTKVLLQIKHRQLVPSLHAKMLNPNIDFEQSPFYVQTELTPWEQRDNNPHRVGISSFGAGGSNAHIIIEEFVTADANRDIATGPQAFLLSAKNILALRQYAEKMIHFLESEKDLSLSRVVYTSQVGRSPMNERLVFIVQSVEELKEKLGQWLNSLHLNSNHLNSSHKTVTTSAANTAEVEGVFHGNVKNANNNSGVFIDGDAGKAFIKVVMENRDLAKLATLWTTGIDMDWSLLYEEDHPQRTSLPTYPFARERHWFELDRKSLLTSIPEQMKPAQGEAKQMMYFVPEWKANSLAQVNPTREITATLIYTASEEFSLLMREQLGSASVTVVIPGAQYRKLENNNYCVDPASEDDFHQLMADLAREGNLPSQIIHYGAGSQGRDIAAEEPCKVLLPQLDYNFYALVYLCKTLMLQKHHAVKLLSIHTDPTGLNKPIVNALGGLFKTLGLEHPDYQAKLVEFVTPDPDKGIETLTESLFDIVKRELAEGLWSEREVRYQYAGGFYQRHTRGFTGYRPQQEHRTGDLPLKEGGVYLISGGLGELGYIFSEYLAKNFKARLVLFGRAVLDQEKELRISELKKYGSDIFYRTADVTNIHDMKALVSETKTRFSAINGVIHSAGTHKDAFILKKNRQDMASVLEAKVLGTVNLDEATKEEPLDLFVLFSSVAGALGNPGQCDYAYANHFIDAFAERREALVQEQQRAGRSLAINWPLWEEGGMTVSRADQDLNEAYAGVSPISTAMGIQFWEETLRSSLVQMLVLYGIPEKVEPFISANLSLQKSAKLPPAASEVRTAFSKEALAAKTEIYLKNLIGGEIKLSPDRLVSDEPFESFGIDSIAINRINAALEKDLGALPKTLLYEYETIDELASYLVAEAGNALAEYLNLAPDQLSLQRSEDSPQALIAAALPTHATGAESNFIDAAGNAENANDEIAIIGIHGCFPQSNSMDEYWENLKQGNDLVGLVPGNRWNYNDFYDPDPEQAAAGKIYCKWGAFLEDFDKFDPGFFAISAQEASSIDPQERLFLQSAWAAIEDAGYTRDSLKSCFPKAKSANVGVFVGSTTNSYHLLAAEEWMNGNVVTTGTHPWSIANRVSYVFDFNGPSLPIDTACSSSLVAIHLACESLKKQECQLAIAGGVNLYLHHTKYRSFCQRRMVSSSGKNFSFGAGDDGFIPGEGVGSIILKPLTKAIEHRDQIYAVIRASGYDHSGRSNGYSAPNPNSQANLISEVLAKGKIHPETIGYIEGHGTGTQMGDSLEIAAITKAFGEQSAKRQFCPIGSVKANLGHSESAAGICGVAKIVMQFKHKLLAPTINSDVVNPNIDFENSPCYLQHQLSPWEMSDGNPRRALINSFGAGGVNACLVLEEYCPSEITIPVTKDTPAPSLIVLSARNEERLQESVQRLLNHLNKEDIDLASLAYTLQTGREAMQERLALAVETKGQLISRLASWLDNPAVLEKGIYRGAVKETRGRRKSQANANLDLENAYNRQDLAALAEAWIKGNPVDWENFYGEQKPNKVSLPTYPFARERYWISSTLVAPASATPVAPETSLMDKPVQAPAQLHPLVSYNSSTLRAVSFISLLADNDFYSRDHQINQQKIFPGAGFLEIACICGNLAGEQRVAKISDVVWMYPLSFEKGPKLLQTFLKTIGNSTDYEMTSINDEGERVVHSEGKLFFDSGTNKPGDNANNISIASLKEKANKVMTGNECYQQFADHGFHYGKSFQSIQELCIGDHYALAKLHLANDLKSDFDRYILHPVLLDGALQAVSGLLGTISTDTPHLPFAIDEIEIIRPLSPKIYAFVEFADKENQVQADIKKFDIQLTNERGDILIKLHNFYVRAMTDSRQGSTGSVKAKQSS